MADNLPPESSTSQYPGQADTRAFRVDTGQLGRGLSGLAMSVQTSSVASALMAASVSDLLCYQESPASNNIS